MVCHSYLIRRARMEGRPPWPSSWSPRPSQHGAVSSTKRTLPTTLPSLPHDAPSPTWYVSENPGSNPGWISFHCDVCLEKGCIYPCHTCTSPHVCVFFINFTVLSSQGFPLMADPLCMALVVTIPRLPTICPTDTLPTIPATLRSIPTTCLRKYWKITLKSKPQGCNCIDIFHVV